MVDTEVLKHEHPWGEQEDDELEQGLIARRKILNQTPRFTTSHSNGQEQVVKQNGQQNGIKAVLDDEDEKDNDKKSDYFVYYDPDKGTELQRESSTVEENGVDSTPIVNGNADNQENGNGVYPLTSNQNGEHQKHDNLSDSSLPISDIPLEELEKSSPSYINNKTEINEIKVITNGVDEIAEFDVETVIKKQETHDLFCPNCNSCITKRVILRKRKRRIPVSSEDSKRNKPETPISDDSSKNQALNGGDRSLDDVQTSESNEYDRQREPDVFRCLSCFSIFMPTGNGFKLFRMFGSKKSEELNQSSQKNNTPIKKHWFSNIFASDKTAELDNQGLVQSDSGNSVLVSTGTTVSEEKPVSSSSLCESNDRELKDDRVQSAISSVSRDGTMNSAINGSDKIEQRVDNKSDNTLNGKQIHSDTHDQLLTAYHTEPNDKNDYPGMFVVKPPQNNIEPSENSTSPLQYDGLKLIVPPNIGSLIIVNSQMNQELDVTVQPNNNNLDIDSQQTVQNNVEVHLEEPQKPNKDVLTGKQIKLVDDLNNIEGIKDTIITVREIGSSGLPHVESGSQAAEPGGDSMATGGRSVDIVKSIVYGGLIELIASLSVVSSSVGAGAATLNVLALGLANIFGGLIVISHDLWDLKNEPERKSSEDRYQQFLGRRSDFPLHVVVSLLSYLVFGFLPPIIYAFSFHERDLKLLTMAAVSILCLIALTAGKVYVGQPPKSYFKTIGYYVILGLMVSGVSYLVGGLIMELLEKMHISGSGSGLVVNLNPSIDRAMGHSSY